MKLIRDISLGILMISWFQDKTDAFQMPTKPTINLRSQTKLHLFDKLPFSPKTSSSSTSKIPIQIQTVQISPTQTDMMDVASLRNNCTSPLQMIENQLKKKQALSEIPKSQSVFNGMKIGLIVGAAISGITTVNGNSMTEALESFVVVTTAVGGMLSINNLSGKNVFVYTEKEAINRLTVDNVPFLKSGDDLGFCARIKSTSSQKDDHNYVRYSGTNGVVACMDGQLRNSSEKYKNQLSYASKKQYGKLPSHFHLKNMLVDEQMRRQGIAKQLLEYVESYVKQNTDAEMLTLEVEDSNTGAIVLYQKMGFVESDTMGADRDYGGGFYLTGRSFMTKKL